MKLIVGLGNPGEKYKNTRHNIGFMVLDEIARKRGVVMRLENQFESEKGDFNIGEERVMLVKPQTFMNNSGEAVSKLKNYYKIDSEDIWVIHDDVDLELGKIRIVLGGSSAGHKGAQSVIDNIGTDRFWRIRVGVGKSDGIPTEDWVLQNFSQNITQIIDKTANIMIDSLSKEIESQTININ